MHRYIHTFSFLDNMQNVTGSHSKHFPRPSFRPLPLKSFLSQDVCACILRCWGRLATESPDILAEHMAQISQILLKTVNSRHSHLAMLSVEFWTSLALKDRNNVKNFLATSAVA